MSDKPDIIRTLDAEALAEALAKPLDLCQRCHGSRTIGAGYIVGGLCLEGQIGGGPHEPRIPCPVCVVQKESENLLTIDEIVKEVLDELNRAESKFAPFNSAHEGYAILLEEVDELWDVVKMKDSEERNKRMHEEAVQVAAMGLKFLLFLNNK